ncbi:MAG: FHA domain-containing protein [Gammaproteobacteria bacterium]|nr:FHA domain-containing protein [Gammaproteobacteria bacterium]
MSKPVISSLNPLQACHALGALRRLLAVACLLLAAGAVQADRIVLLVDNSGSMRMNDVNRLVPAGVDRFIQSLPPDTQVAVVSFDVRGRLIQPLIPAGQFNPAILDQLDYRGPWTDLALAVERGIYELRSSVPSGRDAVLMITDGMMDTGSPEGDLRAESWLSNDLTAQMVNRDISMWVVALSEEADFRILDPITRSTGGSYHRAMTAADVGTAMERIRDAILGDDPMTAPAPVPVPPAATEVAVAPPPATPVAATPETPSSTEASSRGWLAATLLLLGTGLLGWAAWQTLQSRRPLPAPTITPLEYFPDCYLVDLHGATHQSTHPLRGKYNMITRLQQPPDDGIHYIQIFRRQIGRRHALIEYRDFSFWVIDQQSVNGTFLNGDRVMSETRLKHGDRLRFYKYEFEYCVSDLALSNETLIADNTQV